MNFENKLAIGNGIYTISEISQILRIPYYKANNWISKYWDGELGNSFEGRYSWTVDNSKAVSFHTLIEFYILIMFADAGIKTRQVLNSHKELSSFFNTPFPFAQKNIIDNILTDGNKIFFNINGNTISLDGTRQFNLSLVRMFFKNIEFDKEFLASKLWPLGKKKNILVDPKRQFGHPVIGSTNIYPETIFNLFKAGEPTAFIAFTFEISEKDVKHAIEFCQAA